MFTRRLISTVFIPSSVITAACRAVGAATVPRTASPVVIRVVPPVAAVTVSIIVVGAATVSGTVSPVAIRVVPPVAVGIATVSGAVPPTAASGGSIFLFVDGERAAGVGSLLSAAAGTPPWSA